MEKVNKTRVCVNDGTWERITGHVGFEDEMRGLAKQCIPSLEGGKNKETIH
jgi:hypothetical protein